MEITAMQPLQLDGSEGEGGGQILRTALALSMITGRPFRIERIRARRSKPGLLRQHLTAVQAAAAISGAVVQGAQPGSQTLEFAPGTIRGGDYRFAIGTAGSCTLVLQTVLPALWFADAPASVVVTGGTHNPAAPPADFLIRAWVPILRGMGVDMEVELQRHGFVPAGGGCVRATVRPCHALQPLELTERGALLGCTATAVVAGVAGEVARRELDAVASRLPQAQQQIRQLPANEGPGNVLMLELRHERCSELFTSFGARGLPAENVAARLLKEQHAYARSNAAVGEHLADQLVIPLALAGRGRFTAALLSSHLATNIEVVRRFLDVDMRTRAGERCVIVEAG
ncbi:MAG: RNA 3'-terminal phosphate cyclase [Rhodocyclaceae bacterium]|nr:RNA 3'-terminal phosphate cyclase [Rhodocyclaceae bacterium]MBX3668090.1 RNA 3'-terminal phosphate cyclase [Rhodocyclaceae bacterium]